MLRTYGSSGVGSALNNHQPRDHNQLITTAEDLCFEELCTAKMSSDEESISGEEVTSEEEEVEVPKKKRKSKKKVSWPERCCGG